MVPFHDKSYATNEIYHLHKQPGQDFEEKKLNELLENLLIEIKGGTYT